MRRREFIITMAGSAAATLGAGATSMAQPNSGSPAVMEPLSPPIQQAPTLLTAPIELAGDWGHMIPRTAAMHVLERMRRACLDGVRLLSDDQPERLRVEERPSGPPAVWLHYDNTSIGSIIVSIGERDWSRLAYQFGHELGHVAANWWRPDAKPAPPSHWLEEAMVEAFSATRARTAWRTTGRATRRSPTTAVSASAVAVYRQNVVRG